MKSPRTDYETITLSPMTLHIGAEVDGVTVSEPIPVNVARDLRQAFLDWKVLFFRGQYLDHGQHLAFARLFGEPTIGHAVFGHVAGYPELYEVAKHRTANSIRGAVLQRPWSGWHADITAAVNPPKASILRGVTIPPFGGDTLWTNLAAAHDGLSPTLRAFVENLDGIHRFEMPDTRTAGADYQKKVANRTLESRHPLVTVHPETGEKILYVSPDFLQAIDGLAPAEGRMLRELLWEQAIRPEYTVRFKWAPGDVVIWDNRSTLHLAPTDIFDSDHDRLLYRITLVGNVPTGVDGRRSQALMGDPILSAHEELARAR